MEQKGNRIHIDIGIVLVLFFCVCFIYLFVDGAINIVTRNKLEKNGCKVLVTVTDMEHVTGGENDYYLYTMEYEYNGKDYTYTDSSDHDLELGQQMTMYVDPNEPEKLYLQKDSIYLSFLLLIFAIGSMYFSDKFRFFKRNMPTLVLCLEGLIIITGLVLKQVPIAVVGIILTIVTGCILIWLKKRKNTVAM
ncbi:MAG: DUF3592 domain-containing protein [Clostridia bacterium]|nr:DUF3592 domain-containing protein [Clostridia bacterium]